MMARRRVSPLLVLAIFAAAVPVYQTAASYTREIAEPSPHARARYTYTVHSLARDGEPLWEPPQPTPINDAPVFAASIPELICSYPWPCDQALRVAECESGMRADAVNSYSGAAGVFQVVPYWHSWRLQPGETFMDAAVNVRVAYDLWSEQGWAPWSCKPW